MANKKFRLVILIMTLVLGITVVDSVFGQDTALNGKWRARARVGEYENDLVEYTFLAGNYEILKETGADRMGRSIFALYEKGTYTTNAKGEILLKPTHYFDLFNDGKWVSKNDCIKYLKSEEGLTDAEIKETFEDEEMFIDRSFVYSILGSTTLELYKGRQKFTYYKQ